MRMIFTAVLALVLVTSAQADQVMLYSNDFEGTVGSEWSDTSTDTTPIGARRFLGQFCNDSVTLSLNDLPMHGEVTLSLHLYVIRSWDGNVDVAPWGPDVWQVVVSGGPLLCRTTFALYPGYHEQAYPGSHPGDTFPSGTGAAESNTLGYTFTNDVVTAVLMDAVYVVTYTFPHSTSILDVTFAGSGLQEYWAWGEDPDESWGLDNVSVWVTPVPEPASPFVLLGGLAAVPLLRRRRA